MASPLLAVVIEPTPEHELTPHEQPRQVDAEAEHVTILPKGGCAMAASQVHAQGASAAVTPVPRPDNEVESSFPEQQHQSIADAQSVGGTQPNKDVLRADGELGVGAEWGEQFSIPLSSTPSIGEGAGSQLPAKIKHKDKNKESATIKPTRVTMPWEIPRSSQMRIIISGAAIGRRQEVMNTPSTKQRKWLQQETWKIKVSLNRLLLFLTLVFLRIC